MEGRVARKPSVPIMFAVNFYCSKCHRHAGRCHDRLGGESLARKHLGLPSGNTRSHYKNLGIFEFGKPTKINMLF
jgi:hypothetical protein